MKTWRISVCGTDLLEYRKWGKVTHFKTLSFFNSKGCVYHLQAIRPTCQTAWLAVSVPDAISKWATGNKFYKTTEEKSQSQMALRNKDVIWGRLGRVLSSFSQCSLPPQQWLYLCYLFLCQSPANQSGFLLWPVVKYLEYLMTSFGFHFLYPSFCNTCVLFDF